MDGPLNPAPSQDREHRLIRQMISGKYLNPFGLALENLTIAAGRQTELIGCGQNKHHGGLLSG